MIIDKSGFLINPEQEINYKDIDLDNYVIFAGTSHTRGVGVDVQESYPYLVSKYFNYDYVNLSISATGTDVIEHNLLVWSYLYKDTPPKYVFVEWPPEERYVAKYPGYDNYIPVGNWSDDENVKQLLVTGKKIFDNKLIMLYNLCRAIFKCPVIDVRYASLVSEHVDNTNMIWIQRLDRGTDNQHPGPESHKDVSKKIIEHILAR